MLVDSLFLFKPFSKVNTRRFKINATQVAFHLVALGLRSPKVLNGTRSSQSSLLSSQVSNQGTKKKSNSQTTTYMPDQNPNPLPPHLPPHPPKLLLTAQIAELLLPSSLHDPLIEPSAFLQRVPIREAISSSLRMLRVFRQNLGVLAPVRSHRQVNNRERIDRASIVDCSHDVRFELLRARRLSCALLEVAQGGEFGGQ